MTDTIQNTTAHSRSLSPNWKAANAYIRRIKNPREFEYALNYSVWVHDGCPKDQEPKYACSVMAAQAVRDNLRAFGIVEKENA